MTEDNSIFIGKKPALNYVMAVITQFSKGIGNDVVIKARGRSISRAVDVAEIVVRKRHIPGVFVRNIKIGTDVITNEKGAKMNISSIEIYLQKPKEKAGRKKEGRKEEGQKKEGRKEEGKKKEGRKEKGRKKEGRKEEGQKKEGRKEEGQKKEGRKEEQSTV